jgi:hypothetical protein
VPRLLALAVLASLVACAGDEALIQVPPFEALPDAAAPAPIPDGSVACSEDEECDDGVDCTRDRCVEGRYCVSASDNSACSDGVYCNGEEVCDATSGCMSVPPPDCNDENACTVDACDEERKECTHTLRDFDADGEVDWHCLGGTDCDDFDATRGTRATEICDDNVDNDCDDLVDEVTGCGRPPHDRCDDALDVSEGGTFVVDLVGALADYDPACEKRTVRDVVFRFSTDKRRDVTLIARGLLPGGDAETAAIALRDRCDRADSEIECNRGFPGQVRVRALAAGEYFVIVKSEGASRVMLEARFERATDAPTNTTCDDPLDVSEGGHFPANLVDVGDDEDLACGFPGAGDLVYAFTTEREHDVEIAVVSQTQDRMSFGVRSDCSDASTQLRCQSDAPVQGRLHELAPGTYFVIVEGPASREVDFALDIAFLEPTPPPPGDGCGNPISLPYGEALAVDMTERQDLVPVTCGCEAEETGCNLFLRDAVLEVEVDEPTDLALTLEGAESVLAYDFRQSCEDAESQLACGSRYPLNARLRNLQPGAYALVLEATEATKVEVRVDPLPLTVPESVSGNGTCASAWPVPAAGGVFRGDTSVLDDNLQADCGGRARSSDAVFRVELPEPARVRASVEATFDTVLYRFTDGDRGAAACVPFESDACNDDREVGDTTSLLDENLTAGGHYYVVDGFNDSNDGPYTLEITVTQ